MARNCGLGLIYRPGTERTRNGDVKRRCDVGSPKLLFLLASAIPHHPCNPRNPLSCWYTLAEKCLVRFPRANERHLCINISSSCTKMMAISHQIYFFQKRLPISSKWCILFRRVKFNSLFIYLKMWILRQLFVQFNFYRPYVFRSLSPLFY